ncbi:hypothetical protein N7447_001926 [Penicillium robsamsonii]|uniref:uncharacterized protein n=1 Tax=Penicillium robsamsonii TaxID=1792511 RepID=UPI002547AD30|nr:uncharacterized protein N7447_001926 [Penicillium robsamsonii]KAJ5835900.1 hypothetical protein N7447_001926 [Penicillium robsamsonii]
MTLMESEYNSSDSLVTLEEIVQFQAEWANAEPIARTESFLCLGTHGSDEVGGSQDAGSQLCVLACPDAGLDKRSNASVVLSAAKNVFARNIAESEELYSSSEVFGQPSWDGTLTLEYEMLIRTRRGEQILEIK